MPRLFAKQYMRPVTAISRTEKAVGAGILLLTATIVAAFFIHVATRRESPLSADPEIYGTGAEVDQTPGSPPAATAEPSGGFPESGLTDWQRPSRLERYAPDELYVKINGQADAYIESGCVGLTFGSYSSRANAEDAIDVYWYDMGTAANASAVYEDEKPPNVAAIELGGAAYQVGSAVFFWQGSGYVQVMPTSFDDSQAGAALAIARRLADSLPGE